MRYLRLLGKALALLAAIMLILWLLWCTVWQREYAQFKQNSAPILMYHGVGWEQGDDWPRELIIKPTLFAKQLEYLQHEGYNILSVQQLAQHLQQGSLPGKCVALTFDDGYKNNYTQALPLMQQYGAKGTFFVINNDIGKPDNMNEAELKAMLAAGMEIGSHTMNHAPLAKIDPKYLPWELASSRYFLKKQLDQYVVRTLAYPNGSYNEAIIKAAQEYGFYYGVTGRVGVNTPASFKQAPMELYRVNIMDQGDGLQSFKRRLEQAYFCGFLQSKGFDINILRDLMLK